MIQLNPCRFDNAAVYCSNTVFAIIMLYQHVANKGLKTGKKLSRGDGIHAFCITIDQEVRDKLPNMYAASSYTHIDVIAVLPVRDPDIYLRLAS